MILTKKLKKLFFLSALFILASFLVSYKAEASGMSVGTGNYTLSAGENLYYGVTSASNGQGNFLLFQKGGGNTVFQIDYAGNITTNGSVLGSNNYWGFSGNNLFASSTAYNVGIGTTTAGVYKLNVSGNTNILGTLTATSFSGNYTGTIGASNVSSGTFGSNIGNGNFIFPGDLTVNGNLSVVGYINSTVGYRQGGSAVAGNYLRGNGTNFVSSAIQATDVPTLNQSTTGSAYYLLSRDTRSTNDLPQDYNNLVKTDFKSNGTNGLSDGGSYNGVVTFRKYGSGGDFSGGPALQLAYTDNGNLWTRLSTSATTWGSWLQQLTSNTGVVLQASTPGVAQTGNINVTGTVKAGSFSGPYVGTISAPNVSSGEFATNPGGGNFIFGATVPGNVGIGTIAPGYRLDVNGPVALGAGQALTINDNGEISANAFSTIIPDGSTHNGGVQFGTDYYSIYEGSDAIGGGVMIGDSGGIPNAVLSTTLLRLYPDRASFPGNLGIGITAPNYKLDVVGDIHSSGSLTEKKLVFTPTTVGWYRIANSSGPFNANQGGTVRIASGYDNRVTDIEIQYNIGGYSTNGSIQQTRYSGYNSGAVSQARISSDGGGNTYLDIYVASAVTPGPISIYGYGPNMPNFVANPVVGAVAGSTNINTLTFGFGFRSTAGSNFAETTGNVGIGTNNPSAKLDIQGGDLYIGSNAGSNSQRYKMNVYSYDNNGQQIGTLGADYTDNMRTVHLYGSANTNQIKIDSSVSNGNIILYPGTGNVGIGTISPGAFKLNVNGNTNITGSVTANAFSGSLSGTVVAANVSSGEFAANTGGGNFIFGNTVSGNVGIGTSNPTNKLQVQNGTSNTTGDSLTTATAQITGPNWIMNGSSSNGTFLVSTNDTLGQDIGGSIGFAGRYSGTAQATWSTIKGAKEDGTSGNYGGYLAFGTRAHGTQISEKMRISGAGNVGIGTTNPLSNLQIGLLTGTPSATPINLSLGGTYSNTSGINPKLKLYDTGGADYYGLGVSSNQFDFMIPTGANYSWNINGAEKVVIDSSGNVGIGTTAPASPLDVNGGVVVRGNLVIMSGSKLTADKINVSTIDPLYSIHGTNYASFAAAIVGGVKEETVGKISLNTKVGEEYQAIIDFDKQTKGSDLWVWRKVVDFNKDAVDVFITTYGGFANTYYYISGNNLVFRSNKPTEISYRLVAKRFDWEKWPTLPVDQTEKAGLIIK